MASTVSIGLVISSPNTGRVADAVSTTNSENTTKLIGSPTRLPNFNSLNDFVYREKSPKFSIGPAK